MSSVKNRQRGSGRSGGGGFLVAVLVASGDGAGLDVGFAVDRLLGLGAGSGSAVDGSGEAPQAATSSSTGSHLSMGRRYVAPSGWRVASRA